MNQFIIIFEITDSDENIILSLKNKIREYGKFAFITNSSCIIWTDDSHVMVRDNLKNELRIGDKLYVGKTSAPAAWTNSVNQQVSDYIIKNLK